MSHLQKMNTAFLNTDIHSARTPHYLISKRILISSLSQDFRIYGTQIKLSHQYKSQKWGEQDSNLRR